MVVQARNRSRANGTDMGRMRDSSQAEKIKLMNVNIELGDEQTMVS